MNLGNAATVPMGRPKSLAAHFRNLAIVRYQSFNSLRPHVREDLNKCHFPFVVLSQLMAEIQPRTCRCRDGREFVFISTIFQQSQIVFSDMHSVTALNRNHSFDSPLFACSSLSIFVVTITFRRTLSPR